MKRYLLLLLAPTLVFAFGSGTIKKIDQIENNTGADIVLIPANDVKITTFTGNYVLQSGALKEIEESAVSNTELSYLLGITSNAQDQLNLLTPMARLINTTAPIIGGGDLTADRTISIPVSTNAVDGYMSAASMVLLESHAIDSEVVKLLGDQTISGVKTFDGQYVAVSTTNGSHPAPSMTEAEKILVTGMVAGDLIYNTTDSVLNIYDGVEWTEVSGGGGGVPLLSKGALLTSNGITNGEMICNDGESAEWDSAAPEGIKCVTAGGGGGSTITTFAPVTIAGSAASITMWEFYTYNGSQGLKISLASDTTTASTGYRVNETTSTQGTAFSYGYHVVVNKGSSVQAVSRVSQMMYRATGITQTMVFYENCNNISVFVPHAELTVGASLVYGIQLTLYGETDTHQIDDCRLVIEEY